jgi:hypothetical protein
MRSTMPPAEQLWTSTEDRRIVNLVDLWQNPTSGWGA